MGFAVHSHESAVGAHMFLYYVPAGTFSMEWPDALPETERKWKRQWKALSHVQLFATPRTVLGILQTGIVEWVAFPFSRGSSQPRGQTQDSCIAVRILY